MAETHFDISGKEVESIIFEKDIINKVYKCDTEAKLREALEIISKDNLIIYILELDKFTILKDIKKH